MLVTEKRTVKCMNVVSVKPKRIILLIVMEIKK
jgi:hypothetical protein